MLYIVAYDLNKPEQDYPELIKALNGYPSNHIQKSVWLISTNQKANQIVDNLKQYFDKNDTLIVLAWNDDYQGLLTETQWDWIHSHR